METDASRKIQEANFRMDRIFLRLSLKVQQRVWPPVWAGPLCVGGVSGVGGVSCVGVASPLSRTNLNIFFG